MWFICALGALLFWSGSDLFSKIGCRNSRDKLSHLKMLAAVGLVMGAHAAVEIATGTEISFRILLTYLPVSLLYIASMAIGYLGLRYIELSISSPICNSSGAIVAVLTIAVYGLEPSVTPFAIIAAALICVGVICLGVTEASEDEDLRKARQDRSNYHYSKSAAAIAIPVIYCLLDALGTFADSRVLEVLNEDSANVAYELTFLFVGAVAGIYVFVYKREKPEVKSEGPKLIGAVCETAGQFFYIYALADTAHVAFTAPVISSYCVLSVVWSRLFLKEKLSAKHYFSIAAVALGVIILGILDI